MVNTSSNLPKDFWGLVIFQLFVSVLVVFFWRGVWLLFDIYLYPDDYETSSLICVAFGFAFMVVSAYFQYGGYGAYFNFPNTTTLDMNRFIHFIHMLIAGIACVCSWRGIWGLCDIHLLPERVEVSAGLCATIGVLGLALCGHFQSNLAAPVVILSDYDPKTSVRCFRVIRGTVFPISRSRSAVASFPTEESVVELPTA